MDTHNSLENVNINLLKTDTICSLNEGKNTCLPENIIYSLPENNNKINNIKLIIKKISDEYKCGDDENKEICIIKKNKNIDSTYKECLLNTYFKPIGSHDENAWLNNTHIDLIQEQLYRKYPNYYYSFIHMIDNVMIYPRNINCINHKVSPIIEIDFIKELNNKDPLYLSENGKIKWYGVVYNTDPSHKTGQHWFSILFNFSTNGTELDPFMIEYFNSSGLDIRDINFKDFLYKLAFRISFETGKKTIVKKVTNIQHQSINTGNCGIYSLYYIWSRLNGIPLSTFNNPKKIISDDTMKKFRKVMFRE